MSTAVLAVVIGVLIYRVLIPYEKTVKKLQDITEDLLGSNSVPQGCSCGDLADALWCSETAELFKDTEMLDELYWNGLKHPDSSDGVPTFNV